MALQRYMLRQEVEYVHLLRAFPSKIRICFCCDNCPKTFTVLVDLAGSTPYEMELDGKWEFMPSAQGMVVNTADGGCWELNLRELNLHIDGVVPQCEALHILLEKLPN
ncbi:hypothetical protein L1887_27792 [Cichorium endivia]|nr:hypothetical protein L1887_27792 [Cichorium endivia]